MLLNSYFNSYRCDIIPDKNNIELKVSFAPKIEGIKFILLRRNGGARVLTCDWSPPRLPTKSDQEGQEKLASCFLSFLSKFQPARWCYTYLVLFLNQTDRVIYIQSIDKHILLNHYFYNSFNKHICQWHLIG